MKTLQINGLTELSENELLQVNGGFSIPLPFGSIDIDRDKESGNTQVGIKPD